MANIWDRIARDQMEWANGKIREASGLWRFVGEKFGTQLDNGFTPTGKCHSTGRDMELVKGPASFCPNPEMDGKYPMTSDPPRAPNWSVPMTACKKCPHHGKRGEQGISYPHCRWAKGERGGDKGAAKAVQENVAKAVETTSKLMGR